MTFLVGEVASSDGQSSSENDDKIDTTTKCVLKCSCVLIIPCDIHTYVRTYCTTSLVQFVSPVLEIH